MEAAFQAQAALLRQARRLFNGSPSSDEWELPMSPLDGTSDSTESHEDAAPKRKRRAPTKKRKPTYYVRKDEKVRLKAEVEELQKKVCELEATQFASARKELDQSIQMNSLLASTVEDNNMTLAGAQSMISAEMVSRFRNPLDHYIYMPQDEELRKHSLMTLRTLKVDAGTRLIRERMRYLDLCQPHKHSECTVLKNGDYLISQFDVMPYGHTDLKQLFDEFVQLSTSQEVSVSERLGVVCVTESEGSPRPAAIQCRMLASIVPGLDIETNAAMFSKFVDSPDGVVPFYGIGIVDYVDKDDMYEYDSSTRLRMDITGCIYVTQTARASSTDESGVDDGQPGTTMVRFATIRLHRAQFPISRQNERLARASAENWTSMMPRVLLERFGLY